MLPTLLLLHGLLATGRITASPECSRSSPEVCQDLQVATRCGAVEQCQTTFWSQPSAPTLSCELCLKVAEEAFRTKQPQSGEPAVLAALRKRCEWLPNPEAFARCQKLVDHSPQAILSLLGTPGTTPTQACTALTLCQPLDSQGSRSKEEDLFEVGPPTWPIRDSIRRPTRDLTRKLSLKLANVLLAGGLPTQQKCELCTSIMNKAQEWLHRDASRETIKTAAESWCYSLPYFLRLPCGSLMNLQGTQMVESLPSAFSGNTCKTLKMCAEKDHPSSSSEK